MQAKKEVAAGNGARQEKHKRKARFQGLTGKILDMAAQLKSQALTIKNQAKELQQLQAKKETPEIVIIYSNKRT